MGGRSLARRVYLGLAWVFLASVIVQVFLIGYQLFADGDPALHMGFGYLVLLLSLVVVGGAFAAGTPGRSKRWAGALFGVTLVQVVLAGLRYGGPGIIAALHPVNALLVFWVAVQVIRDAREQLRMPAVRPAPDAAPAEATAGPS